MYKYISRRHALLLLLVALAILVGPDDPHYNNWRATTIPSSVSVCTSSSATTDVLDSSRPPAPIMAGGLALLAVPLVMRLAAHMSGGGGGSGAGDMASAMPAISSSSLDVGIRASPGCTTNNPVALDTTLNVTLGSRRYLLYIPVNYQPDTPAPVVLSYHGGTRTAEFQLALDRLTSTDFNQDYIVVYPNGIAVCPARPRP